MTSDCLLVVRRRVCGCSVGAAVPGSAPARELERGFGSSREYRVVAVIGRPSIVRCQHAGSRYCLATPREDPAMTTHTRHAGGSLIAPTPLT
jgi:hypothetical protein